MTDKGWSLPVALGISEGPELAAFVGGGGKTSLMFALAAALPGRVVVTTTTRIFAAQMRLAPAVVYANDLAPLGEMLNAHRVCLVAGRVAGDKALGVPVDLPARLLQRPDVDYVLVEADGARMKPVKAPAAHEPVIPAETTLLVPLAGVDALEAPIEETTHRPELLRELLNGDFPTLPDGRLTPPALAHLLAHPEGGLKNAPPGARVVPFLNKVETAERRAAARETATHLLAEPRIGRVALGALRGPQAVSEVRRRVTAVVLAAGESRRMGRNKLLLPWGDTTVLGRTLANVLASAVNDVLVVTGHERERSAAIAAELGAPTLHNIDYAKGMLTSVQTAVAHLPANSEAALVMLGDQPAVAAEVIDALLLAYAQHPHGLVAPTYDGRRGNPVLIDRRYFAELVALPPEAAPRVLLQRHGDDLLLVETGSEAILQDLDRPEEYERLRPPAP